MSKLRRRKYDQATDLCTGLLRDNPYDKAVWFIKCRALTGRRAVPPPPSNRCPVNVLVLG